MCGWGDCDKEENGNLYFVQTKAIEMLVFYICKEAIWLFGLNLTSLHLKQFPSVTAHFLCTVRSGKVLLISKCLKAV